MSTKFYALLTDIGAAKLASAAVLGVPLKITHMAVGDGGRTLSTPDTKQTALVNEKCRAALNMLYIDPQNSSQIIAEQVIPENEGGWWTCEVGLFDESGVLIAVGNCPESYKPQLAKGNGRTQAVRMVLIASSTDNITLKIDPVVVLVTRKYVDDKISGHEQSRHYPDVSPTTKGFTQLSSATNSEPEILTATPKAAKTAYDPVVGKTPASRTHPRNQITDVPAASLTIKGTVQLSSATNSTPETQATTPKAVKAAYNLAADKALVSHTHPWSQITNAPAASLTIKGTAQLSSATNNTSETQAATPKVVKAVYDPAAGKAPISYTRPWSQITDVPTASLTIKGTVQLSSATNSTSETQAATPKAVKAAYDLVTGRAPVGHTHPWSQITGVPIASPTVKGIVQLSSATNSTLETRVATPKAVKAVYDLVNGKQPADATLTTLAGLATAAGKLPYFTESDTTSLAALTSVGRNIPDKASTQAVTQYLGLSDVSGYVGRWLNTRVFTSSDTYTPTPGTKRTRVTITGGGGGGGGCKAISDNKAFLGAGGGAGRTVISIMTSTQNSYLVTIGVDGADGISATNGTSGGNSVFASLIAPGGAGDGKVGVTNTDGGSGGVPSTGDIRITGGSGGDGQSGNISVSGEGGTSYWGGGGRAGAGGGVGGKAYGSGGGGAYDAGYSGTSMTGGEGATGIYIVGEFAQ